MTSENNKDNDEVENIEIGEQTELDKLNTERLQISVPKNSVLLIVAPYEDVGLIFQRHSTITSETMNEGAVGAANLVTTVMWALQNKPKLFSELLKEMMEEDWTINIQGNA